MINQRREKVIRNILRERENDWCMLELEVRLVTGIGRCVSICGSVGEVVSSAEALEMVDPPDSGHEPFFEQNGKVYLIEGTGQITAVEDWFPEILPYRKWHMRPLKEGDDESWVRSICPNDQSFGEQLPKLSEEIQEALEYD